MAVRVPYTHDLMALAGTDWIDCEHGRGTHKTRGHGHHNGKGMVQEGFVPTISSSSAAAHLACLPGWGRIGRDFHSKASKSTRLRCRLGETPTPCPIVTSTPNPSHVRVSLTDFGDFTIHGFHIFWPRTPLQNVNKPRSL